MPKFCANLTTMFPEHPILDRFGLAFDCGFDAVEILFPYSTSAHELQRRLEDCQLKLVLINAALGDTSKGQRGIGALPGLETEFRQSMKLAFEYAQRLNVRSIHVMAGVVEKSDDCHTYEETFVKNLQAAASIAEPLGIDLMVEPLNLFDVPDYLITSSDHAISLLNRIDRTNVKLQYDFYHMQIMEGDLGRRVAELFPRIGHIQFSSRPGRNEPQYGEVNVDYLFKLLDDLGYEGYVGCEYTPKNSVLEGLNWAAKWGVKPR